MKNIESKKNIPAYLYKIISIGNWEESQNKKYLILPPMDRGFIHLSTLEQLDKVISKFWYNHPQFCVLKVRPDKLQGELIFETNPGGTTKYYHLYNGLIPMDSVVEAIIINCQPTQ